MRALGCQIPGVSISDCAEHDTVVAASVCTWEDIRDCCHCRPALWLATGACASGMVRTEMVRLLHDLAPLLFARAAPPSAELQSAVADTCWAQLLRCRHQRLQDLYCL